VTTGIEWAIPLAAIGNPSGPIRVSAFVATVFPGVSNQVLGPLPIGTCTPGVPSAVDFGGYAGDQLFTIDMGTPIRRTSWGRLKLSYR
jgi:hypothetical protein